MPHIARLFRLRSVPFFAAPARRRDVFGAYRIAFGRDPETEAAIADRMGQPIHQLLRAVFMSDEFRGRVRDRLLAGGAPIGARFDAPPNGILRRWAAVNMPLSVPGRVRLLATTNWPDLFAILLGDRVFTRTVFEGGATGRDLTMLHLLKARRQQREDADVIGEVEIVTAYDVRGWASDRKQPARALNLQLWIGDRLIATALAKPTGSVQRAATDGASRPGFHFHCPGGMPGRSGERAEVRDAATLAIVAQFIVEEDIRGHSGVVAQMRRELSDLRHVLDRIEGSLPALHASAAFALADWGAYFETFYGAPPPSPHPTTPLISVIIDTTDVSPALLANALDSIARQTWPPAQVIVAHRGKDGRLGVEAELDRWRDRLASTTVLLPLDTCTAGDDAWFAGAAAGVTADHVAFLPAYARLAPDALAKVAHTLATGALFVYGDEDMIDPSRDDATARHAEPLLLGAFDHDLLLQQRLPGCFAAVPRTHALKLPRTPSDGPALRDALCLSAYEAAGRAAIVHIPRVLCHSAHHADASVADDRRTVISAHLDRLAVTAMVGPHADPCGAIVTEALRIRFPAPDTVSLAIIIPTRDRLDLLQPCIASIQASLPANRARVETIIVDNRSTSEETRAYLAAAGRLPGTRVVTHDDAFNWALINNRAAATAEADVLVFLNNDTCVLTTDCWDELAAQAMRCDVGAVGARLLYGDGSIQHAGIVLDPWHSFASHDGVGMAASDPGYLGRNSLVREVSAVTGACIATRRDVFRQHGGFDERFPVEGNDTDYCLRLRSDGLRILYDPFATLHHFESKSRGANDTEAKRATADAATARLQARWAERFAADPFYNPHFDRLSLPFTRLQPPPAA